MRIQIVSVYRYVVMFVRVCVWHVYLLVIKAPYRKAGATKLIPYLIWVCEAHSFTLSE